MNTSTTQAVTDAMQKLIDDFAFEAGKSAIGVLQGVDSRSPEGVILKQGFNRAQAALEFASVQDAKDALRWKTLLRALSSGHLRGPGYGRRIKLVETCPMYGEEKEVNDIVGAVDAAILSTASPAGEGERP